MVMHIDDRRMHLELPNLNKQDDGCMHGALPLKGSMCRMVDTCSPYWLGLPRLL